MASADQLKSLLKSHIKGDDHHFFSVVMQIAAHEARLGHGKLAEELRALVDDAKRRRGPGQPVPISRPRGELAGLLTVLYPKVRLNDMILDSILERQLNRVIREQRHAARLLGHGLSPRRKLLLVGPPGTGKTLTASVLAGELGLPLFQVRLDGLLTKFMGETAAKLRKIFDATGQTRGVFFFDEFDAIGSQRGLPNDVGEIRRILNSFLQMIEQDESHSLIVGASNHHEILDHALFRRFDDVLHYELPTTHQIEELFRTRIGSFLPQNISWKGLIEAASGLSQAEITRAANDVIKEAIIQERMQVTENEILQMVSERRSIVDRLKRST